MLELKMLVKGDKLPLVLIGASIKRKTYQIYLVVQFIAPLSLLLFIKYVHGVKVYVTTTLVRVKHTTHT